MDLAAQGVEIVGRRRQVAHLHIVFGAHLQVALKPGRGMLRTLTFIAMRQQHDETRHAQPFALARRNELVEENLRAVREIAELGFPQGQRVRVRQRVAILIAEDRFFGEQRVDHLILGLSFTDMVEGRVFLARRLVDDMAVALREGTAAAILTGQADREAFIDQRREGEMLRRRPVETLAAGNRLRAAFQNPGQRLVDVDPFRHLRDGLAKCLQPLPGDAGLAAAFVVMRQAEALPFAVQPVGLLGLERLARLELAVEIDFEIRHLLVHLFGGQQAFGHEAPRIDFPRRRVALDLLVHQGLGEHRLVTLIVAEAPVAEHVDDDILVEFLPVLRRHLGGVDHRFRIVTVHVEDRRLHHQGHIRRIGRRARIHRARREADLVVHDEVDRAARAVALQARQRKALGHHPLPRKRRVAMQQ